MTHKSNKDKTKPKAHVENSVPSFIRKTYEILEENKFPDIIDWNPEGNALVIKKPAEFCQKVLPAYFKHNNLTSFVRQLNMYNFHKRRTQNIDHVYYHELFQKGKKHLLKEIKRKNHDHSNDKQKSPEANENSNKKELSSIAYENQMLKRLYNEAITKISALETQIQDATAQNQSLWSQISQTTETDQIGNPLTVRFDQQTIVSQPSIPQEIMIPPLRFDNEHQNTPQANPFAKPANGLKEEVTDSTATDGSHNSPSLHAQAESDKLTSLPENGQSLQGVQDSQAVQYKNDLFISKKETSVGYLFESWNAENTEIMAFADQKLLDRPLPNYQAIPQDVLGKRVYDQNSEVKDFGSEPTKRHELSIFNRRNLISTGTEEKDPIMMRNEDYETNLAVDLMDFNQPFC